MVDLDLELPRTGMDERVENRCVRGWLNGDRVYLAVVICVDVAVVPFLTSPSLRPRNNLLIV